MSGHDKKSKDNYNIFTQVAVPLLKGMSEWIEFYAVSPTFQPCNDRDFSLKVIRC